VSAHEWRVWRQRRGPKETTRSQKSKPIFCNERQFSKLFRRKQKAFKKRTSKAVQGTLAVTAPAVTCDTFLRVTCHSSVSHTHVRRWEEAGLAAAGGLLSQRKTAPMLLQQHCSTAAAAIRKSFLILSTAFGFHPHFSHPVPDSRIDSHDPPPGASAARHQLCRRVAG